VNDIQALLEKAARSVETAEIIGREFLRAASDYLANLPESQSGGDAGS
jgi:hypothetical protein